MQTYGTLLARRRVPGERARLRQQQLAAQQAKQQQQVRFELQQQQQLLNRLKGNHLMAINGFCTQFKFMHIKWVKCLFLCTKQE